MTNYQKAIKLRKVCENIAICKGDNICQYFDKCKVSELEKSPCFERIETLAVIIKKEKWNIK